MAINKVMDSIGNLLLDLTNDTITPDKVLEGYTFHDKSGELRAGTIRNNIPLSGYSPHLNEDNVVRFIDYDGTIVAEYTIAEANALTELPTLPNPTDVNFVVFEGWNHTLQEVQETTHSLCVGATYDTIDHHAHLMVTVVDLLNIQLYIYVTSRVEFTVDWGDGTITSHTMSSAQNVSHTYQEVGNYEIIFSKTSGNEIIYVSSSSRIGIYAAYLGSLTSFRLTDQFARPIKKVTVSNLSTAFVCSNYMGGDLKVLIIPKNLSANQSQALFDQGSIVEYVSFPKNFNNSIKANATMFEQGKNTPLRSLILPENLTSAVDTSGTTNVQINFPYLLRYFYMPAGLKVYYNSINVESKFLQNLVLPETSNIRQDGINTLTIRSYTLQEINITPRITSVIIAEYAGNVLKIPNTVKQIQLGGTTAFGSVSGPSLCGFRGILDLTAFEAPPVLSSGNILTIPSSIKIMVGTLSLYQNASNWSRLYALGLLEEVSE